MKLIFLGSGSAFTVGACNYHSNMMLEDDQKHRLLIDCGSDVRLSLYDIGLNYKDIEAVYVSHLHADHVGGLEWLGFTTKFDLGCHKPKLFANEEIISLVWERVLSGGLNSLQTEHATLSTYFEPIAVKEDHAFHWHNIKFDLVRTIHVFSGDTLMPSYGIFFKIKNINILITTDTQFCPNLMMPFYQKADVIFHDCETTAIRSGVHSHFNDLKTLDLSLRQKMWLYHYNPGNLPDAKSHGFRGYVQKGQIFNFDDKKTFL